MKIVNQIREWVRKIFPIKTIQQIYKTDIAISSVMLAYIDEWEREYSGKAPWVDNKEIISLRLEYGVVREFTEIVLNEMTTNITVEMLDKIYQKALRKLNINLKKGLATGAMIIKPLGADRVQYVPQSAFIPLEYDVNGRLVKVIFPEIKKISDTENLIRLETHLLDYQKGLTIENRAFRSDYSGTLGKEIPLESVPEWSGLAKKIYYPMMKRPAFGYYVNPIDNTIDGSHSGISIFESAKHIIKKADIQFGRLDWEFQSGERRINIDTCAFQIDEYGNPMIKDKIFRAVDSANLFQEFSPVLREANYIAGLEEYKRNIEFSVGLAYGDISNPNMVAKTATEIKSAKDRKFNTVKAIQNNLRDCLEDLAYAFAFYNGMTEKYDFICSFKDSILSDEESERKQDIQDLQLGILRPEEYRAKWHNESIEEALKNLPESAEVLE